MYQEQTNPCKQKSKTSMWLREILNPVITPREQQVSKASDGSILAVSARPWPAALPNTPSHPYELSRVYNPNYSSYGSFHPPFTASFLDWHLDSMLCHSRTSIRHVRSENNVSSSSSISSSASTIAPGVSGGVVGLDYSFVNNSRGGDADKLGFIQSSFSGTTCAPLRQTVNCKKVNESKLGVHDTVSCISTTCSNATDLPIQQQQQQQRYTAQQAQAQQRYNAHRVCGTCHADYSSGNWYKDKVKVGEYMCKSCYVCMKRRLQTVASSNTLNYNVNTTSSSSSSRTTTKNTPLLFLMYETCPDGVAANQVQQQQQPHKKRSRKVKTMRRCCDCLVDHSSGDWYRDNIDPTLFNCQRCYQRKKRARRI